MQAPPDRSTPGHGGPAGPSPWVERFAGLAPADGTVLDLACGSGRHVRYFRDCGHPVTALDRDVGALAGLGADAGVETIAADLENGRPWPLGQRRFALVVVTNYLWRPLLPAIVGTVAPGGALVYETFAHGNERLGRPSNPDFLLRPGELLEAVRGRLRVLAYEDLYVERPKPAMVQRIAAVNENPS
jgi:SAM-dependent methyltransferase